MTREQAFQQAFKRVAREIVVCGECARRATYEDMLYCEHHKRHVCCSMYVLPDVGLEIEMHRECHMQHSDCA